VIDLSVVVPCYNESANLPRLVASVSRAVPPDISMEVIFVDNGSTDDSARVLAELLPRHTFAVGVRVPVNAGYGHGILTGLRRATGRIVGWTHADLQTDPRDVVDGYRAFRTPLLEGRTVLKGRRVGRPVVDRVFTGGMSAIASLALSSRFSDVNAQPKLFPRALLDDMGAAPADFSLDLYLLWLAGRMGYAVVEHPVAFGTRTHGEAKGGGSLRTKWRLTRRTLAFIRTLRRQIRAEAG
jgi:glycosyltransferase involved in cell wall biosynthesis